MMDILDVVAWMILAGVVSFIVLPAIFVGNDGYWKGWLFGHMVVLTALLVALLLSPVVWAFLRVVGAG